MNILDSSLAAVGSRSAIRFGVVLFAVAAMMAPTHAQDAPVNISLNGVVAIAADDIWAVGNGTDPNDADNTDPAFEHWNGSAWQIIPSKRTLEDQELINGVGASGPNDVWAVGSVGQPFTIPRQIEIQHWDGNAWSFVAAEQVTGDDLLDGVAAIAPDDAWAVGSTRSGGARRDRALAEHWNGSQWRSVPLPDPQGVDFLHKVAAVSSTDVWAVGSFQPAGDSHPLAMHWDGTTWSIVPVPAPPRDCALSDVVAIASDNVWAVGTSFEFSVPSHSHGFIVHWDGTAWSVVSSPSTGSFDADGLATVTAISSKDIWSLGNSVNQRQQTLAEHWNGRAWKFFPAPTSFVMNDAAAVASDDVWAVGWNLNASIIEHWDGRRWSVVPSP